MKWMIASDIHGSAYYCKKMIEAFREEKADKLLLLGDILYHGPRNDFPKEYAPKEVFAMLNEIKEDILCVKGNCDSEVDQMVLEFPIMTEYATIGVESNSGGIRLLYATHGHVTNPENAELLSEGTILLNGHTHVPACEACGKFIYMNPGSVSLPKEESAHGYMVIEKGMVQWKDFQGEMYKTYEI